MLSLPKDDWVSDFSIEGCWLREARRVPSPNSSARPADTEVSLLVVHSISLPSGEFGGEHVDSLFTNTLDPAAHASFQELADLRVSSHLFLNRSGAAVQYVPFNRAAWHAGASSFMGHTNCNPFSIGIELEGTGDLPYTELQYQALIGITHCLMTHFPALTPQRIVGHSDIAPGRKIDPGLSFDWTRYLSALSSPASAS